MNFGRYLTGQNDQTWWWYVWMTGCYLGYFMIWVESEHMMHSQPCIWKKKHWNGATVMVQFCDVLLSINISIYEWYILLRFAFKNKRIYICQTHSSVKDWKHHSRLIQCGATRSRDALVAQGCHTITLISRWAKKTWLGVVVSDQKKKVTGDKKLKQTFLWSYIVLFVCWVDMLLLYDTFNNHMIIALCVWPLVIGIW